MRKVKIYQEILLGEHQSLVVRPECWDTKWGKNVQSQTATSPEFRILCFGPEIKIIFYTFLPAALIIMAAVLTLYAVNTIYQNFGQKNGYLLRSIKTFSVWYKTVSHKQQNHATSALLSNGVESTDKIRIFAKYLKSDWLWKSLWCECQMQGWNFSKSVSRRQIRRVSSGSRGH